MQKKNVLLAVAIVLLTYTVSAGLTQCNPSSYSNTVQKGSSLSQLSITCSNPNNASVTVNRFGDFFTTIPDTIFIINGNANQEIKINLDTNKTAGMHDGAIFFSDGIVFPLSLNITSPIVIVDPEPIPGSIIVFPTNKVLSVVQGQEKTQNIILTVPLDYPRTVTIQSVDFNPGTETIKFGDLNLGQVPPGQSISIPIVFSGKGAEVGTYQTNLKIFALDSKGQISLPTISLQLQVTTGISAVTNETFSTRPACALSANTLNANSTYTFTCSGISNNLEVNPLYNEFIEGKSVDTSSGIFTYTFKPVRFGTTNFIATFTYKGAPIFAPFSQEIKVTSSTGQVPGIDLRLLFTPALETLRSKDTVAIQLVDNKSGSLVEDPYIEINAIPISNATGKTFFATLETNKNYTVRGKTTGYNDLVQVIRIDEKPIEIKITPTSGDSQTTFTITNDVNATIFVDGEKKGTSYTGFISAGNKTIEAFKEGFTDSRRYFFVDESLTFSDPGILKKGALTTIILNKNTTWSVFYQKDVQTPRESLSNAQGNGLRVEFTPTKAGTYIIETDKGSKSYTLEGWDGYFWIFKWYIWGVIVGLLGIMGFIYRRNGGSKSHGVDVGYRGDVKY